MILKLFCQLLTSITWTVLSYHIFKNFFSLPTCCGYSVCAKRYIMNYLLLLHIFETTSVNARRGQLWLPQPQKLFKTSFRLGAFACVPCCCWICLVVACGFMESLKLMAGNKFKKRSIFPGGKCVIRKSVNGECREMGRITRKKGAMPTCYRLTFITCCSSFFSLPFSVFERCASWIPFCIFCYVSHAVV